jgi:hypothetical protein
MEYQLGLLESGRFAEVHRRHSGTVASTQEETVDPVPEEQSNGEKVSYGSAV